MQQAAALTLIKTLHTLIWLFFNGVIFYMLYAVLTNQLGIWLWIGYGLIGMELITLLIFKMRCPLTLVARTYSASTKENFDIYLPNLLAKYNKEIYSIVIIVILALTVFQLIKTK